MTNKVNKSFNTNTLDFWCKKWCKTLDIFGHYILDIFMEYFYNNGKISKIN